MDVLTTHQGLTIFAWFILAALVAFVLLIARFYQRTFKKTTYFWAFAVPLLLFGVASARYGLTNQVGGDTLADALWAIGGIILIVLCTHLYFLMKAR